MIARRLALPVNEGVVMYSPDRHSYVATERAALVAAWLMAGHHLTAAQVAEATGLKRRGAWYLLDKISRVLPIACVDGVWYCINPPRR